MMHNIFDENDKLEKALNYEQKTFSKIDFKSLIDEFSIAKKLEDLYRPNLSKQIIQSAQNIIPIIQEIDFKSLLDELSIAKKLEDLYRPDLSKQIVQSIQNITPIFSEIDYKSLFDEFSIIKQLEDELSIANQLSKLYSSEFISDSLNLAIEKNQNQIDEIAKTLSRFSPALSLGTMDFSEIEMLSDMSIKYGDIVLSKDEVVKEFESQLKELKQKPKSLHDKFEDVKKKFWLVLLIISLIMFIPQVVETSKFYIDMATQIKALLTNEMQYCYVIKEKAYLRETSNAKSKILCTLLYDTKLETISEIPRWFEVKYVDESGNEYIGWISKISVEKE